MLVAVLFAEVIEIYIQEQVRVCSFRAGDRTW